MKNIIIVGAGGMGRKLFACLSRMNAIEKRWNIKGCIDDNINALDGINTDLKLIGTIKDWVPDKNELFAMGISDPKNKYEIAKVLIAKGACFETIISPDVILGEYVEVGEGSFANLTTAVIGKGVYVGSHAVLLPGLKVGDGAYIGVGSIAMKDVKQYTQIFGNPARVIGELETFDFN